MLLTRFKEFETESFHPTSHYERENGIFQCGTSDVTSFPSKLFRWGNLTEFLTHANKPSKPHHLCSGYHCSLGLRMVGKSRVPVFFLLLLVGLCWEEALMNKGQPSSSSIRSWWESTVVFPLPFCLGQKMEGWGVRDVLGALTFPLAFGKGRVL